MRRAVIRNDSGDIRARFKAHGNKAVLPCRQQGGLLAVEPAHAHARAAHRRKRRLAALVELLQAHGEAHQAEALVRQLHALRLPRLHAHHLVGRRVMLPRRADRHDAHFARGKQRRHRHAAIVRRDLDARARRIRDCIYSPADGRAVFIDARENQTRLHAGERDALAGIRQRERLGNGRDAQLRGCLLVHAQGIRAGQRLHAHIAVLHLHLPQRFAGRADQRERFQPVKRLRLRLAALAHVGAQQCEALRFERQQAGLHLHNLTRADLNAQRAIVRNLLATGKRPQLHMLRRLHRHDVLARREGVRKRLVAAIQRIRAERLARLARQRHARARNLLRCARAQRYAAHGLLRRQRDDRRGAALHDHQSLAHRQYGVALAGKAHGVLPLQQSGLRLAVFVRDERHRRLGKNLHVHAGKRHFAALSVVADDRKLHRKLHGADRWMLKRHARARGVLHLHADAIARVGDDVRLPAGRDAGRVAHALRQRALLHAVDARPVAIEHSLTVRVADQRERLPVLRDDGEAHALDRLAQRILRCEHQLALHRVAHDDLAVRHRDERLAVKGIALRRALLAQIKLRALRKGEARLALARADAHRLRRVERIGPRGQFPAAGNDIDAELRAGKRLALHRIVVLRPKRKARHAQRIGAALRLHGHRRDVNQIADPLFLRLRCRAGQQHGAKRRAYPLVCHIQLSSERTNRPAAGELYACHTGLPRRGSPVIFDARSLTGAEVSNQINFNP